jgi:hypothetical protein
MKLYGDKLDSKGNKPVEHLELWLRNIVDCVRDLIGNPTFREHMAYAPEKVYRDLHALRRIYDQAWTADWWHETQVRPCLFMSPDSCADTLQKKIPVGGTIASISIFADETHLTNFSGNKKLKPVYMTINNIEKGIRRKKSSNAHILLGYIPVPKYNGFKKASKKDARQQFFHDCMSRMVAPLIAAGVSGVEMICADGRVRRVFPILACFVADAPEQALAACTKENYCPKCPVDPKERGEQLYADHTGRIPLRDPGRTLNVLKLVARTGRKTPTFKREGLRLNRPFWADLPHTNIFMSITPDILHQLHNGVFGDHLVLWLQSIIAEDNEDELDNRFRALCPYPGLRRFRDGLAVISQWSGNEHRELEKTILGCIAGVVPPRAFRAAEALLTLVYYMRWESHDEPSLNALYAALDAFHEDKDIFIELGLREDFDFPKLHALQHYVDSIRLFGSADGYSTEISERLHIDFAKHAYHATNRREYIRQMTRWLERHEKMAFYAAYQEWFGFEDARARGQEVVLADLEERSYLPRLGLRVDGPHSSYVIAKQAPSRNVPVSTLCRDSPGGYHATEFVDSLSKFVRSAAPPGALLPDIKEDDKLNLYLQMTVLVPGNAQTGRTLQRDRIRAVPMVDRGSAEPSSAEAFSTVLVHVAEQNANTAGTALARESGGWLP